MDKKFTAVLFGGNSYEHDISIVSAIVVMNELKKINIDFIPIYISHEGIMYTGNALLKKENYSSKKNFVVGNFISKGTYYFFKAKNKIFNIDFILPCVHGYGVEDGTIAGFFDLLNIPIACSSLYTSMIFQNKYITKKLLSDIDVPSPYFKLFKFDTYLNEIESLASDKEYIIKPNHLGSSVGVFSATTINIKDYFIKSFEYDDEVIIEEKIPNLIEYNIAICGNKAEYIVSDIETIKSNKKGIYSFEDKYEVFRSNESNFDTSIPNRLKEKIQQMAIKVFTYFNCRGVVRFDFLYNSKTKELFFNEANTIPGSLSIYLFTHKGYSFKEVYNLLRKVALFTYKNKNLKLQKYGCDTLSKINMNKY
ncbi:MAG: ATP-grasp domain-containing protein [Bacilli bacterium]